jgi:uncharacterized protein YycO
MNSSYAEATRHGLQPGDRVITHKSPFGIIKHHSLYVGMDAAWNAWVIENVAGEGVKWTRLDELVVRNGDITGIERFIGTDTQRSAAVNRALSKLGLPYDVLSYNCEHFVNEVVHGKRQSRQLEVFGGIAALFIALVVVRNL